ncbi:MAG TPA: hypothetical protein EYG89_05305 [Bacteroidia bacterium]|nr:hypothetical protein [Bacteroidia bacterium]
MKKTIYLLFIFISSNTHSQINSIQLPEYNKEINFYNATPIISFYITKNNNIFIEKEKVDIYNVEKNIAYYKYKLPFQLKIRIRAFLYIDNEVDYKIIDKIKTYLARNEVRHIIYKTNSTKDKDFLKGLYWRNHLSFFKIEKSKFENNKHEIKNNFPEIYKNDPPPPLPPPSNWTEAVYQSLYTDDKIFIKKALENIPHKALTLTNEGLKLNTKTLTSKDISTLFKKNKAIIITFSIGLKYKNYFKTIKQIKELYNKIRMPYIYEISNEIYSIHEKSNITFEQ